MDSISKFMRCKKHNGELTEYTGYDYTSNARFYCGQCKQEKEFIEMCERSGIPKRFADRTFENYEGKIDFFDNYFSFPFDIVLSGNVGTGKTHLAVAVVKKFIELSVKGFYAEMLPLIRSIKETWHNTSKEKESDVIKYYSSVGFLAIDEIGVQFYSNTEKMYLTEIMNNRYNNLMPTMLIGNLSISEFRSVLGDRIIDRISENGKVIFFEKLSRRPQRKTGLR